MVRFSLSKWYMDCVTETGDVSIAYTGTVNWGRAQLSYSSVLDSTPGRLTANHSTRKSDEPAINGDSISWRSEPLHVQASWQVLSPGWRDTIFSSHEGSVDWHCLMPCARAQFGGRYGLGYVDHVTMTLPPWKLPIQFLRWGRFTSDGNWAVWVDWQSEYSRRFVYLNGVARAAASMDDGHIRFADGALLEMDRSLIIREGPLGSTVLSGIPGLKKTFPARLLGIHECKWRSRASLRIPERPAVEGWAIHEIVSWPK